MENTGRGFLRNTILSFSAIVGIVVFLLTTILFAYYEKAMQRQLYQYSFSQLKQTANTVQFLSEYVLNTFVKLTTDNFIMGLSELKSIDAIDVRSRLMQLEATRMSFPAVYSIYIYNRDLNTVFVSGANESRMIYDLDYFHDSSFRGIVADLHQYNRYIPYFRSVNAPIPAGGTADIQVYTYLYYVKTNTGATTSICAINFSRDWIEKSIGYFKDPFGVQGTVRIVDRNDTLLFSQNPHEDATIWQPPDYLARIHQTGKPEGYLLAENGGEKCLVTYVTIEQWGYENWVFVSENQYDRITRPIRGFQKLTASIGVLIFLISLLAILLRSHRIYSPIQSRIDILVQQQKHDREVSKRFYLARLLNGTVEISMNNALEQFSKYQFALNPLGQLLVLLICLDHYSTNKSNPEWMSKHAPKMLQHAVCECIGKRFPKHEFASCADGILSVVLELSQEDEDLWCQPLSFPEKLIEGLREKGYSVSVVVSEIGHTYRDLPYLYQEAIRAKSLLFVQGIQSVVQTAQLGIEEKKHAVYPKDCEKEILSALSNGNCVQAIEAFKRFSEILSEGPIHSIRLALLHLGYWSAPSLCTNQ